MQITANPIREFEHPPFTVASNYGAHLTSQPRWSNIYLYCNHIIRPTVRHADNTKVIYHGETLYLHKECKIIATAEGVFEPPHYTLANE